MAPSKYSEDDIAQANELGKSIMEQVRSVIENREDDGKSEDIPLATGKFPAGLVGDGIKSNESIDAHLRRGFFSFAINNTLLGTFIVFDDQGERKSISRILYEQRPQA